MRILFTGGGTLGHTIPNLAVIEEFIKNSKKHHILYIGSRGGPEKEAVVKFAAKLDFHHLEYKEITCGKLRRYFSWQNFIDAFKVPIGFFQALRIIGVFKPEIVFSKGGYVAVPVVFAAKILGIPVFVHESDVVPGLGNRICASVADKILLSFEESKKYFKNSENARDSNNKVAKFQVTGNPVRSEILKGAREKGMKLCGFYKFKPVVLIMGGSLGAMQINKLVWDNLDSLLKKYQIAHIVGKGNLKFGLSKEGYKQFELLFDELKDVYAACDLIVSRGGANSLAEIAALGRNAVVIPLGTAGSRGDQLVNAKVCAKKYGWQVLYGDVTSEQFSLAIELALKSGQQKAVRSKSSTASKAIFELIQKMA